MSDLLNDVLTSRKIFDFEMKFKKKQKTSSLTPATIDEADMFKSFRRRASITRNGGSITQPQVKQNFA